MSKNSEAEAKKVAGSLTEAIGKITGDTQTQEAGKAKKEAGESQTARSAKTAKQDKPT